MTEKKEKEDMKVIVGRLRALQEDSKTQPGYAQNNTHLGDTHGDIYKLAGALIASGAAVIGDPEVVKIDVTTGDKMLKEEFDILLEQDKNMYIKKYNGKIMTKKDYDEEQLRFTGHNEWRRDIVEVSKFYDVPNLIKNTNYKGTFIQTGDIIDRGKYSAESYLLMHSLIKNNNEEKNPNIIFLLGNHEITYPESPGIHSYKVRELLKKDVEKRECSFYSL
ncbi:MAG: hypothetical protein Ta2D_04860 [Rickettsiales bacterium]|nr:MAG: hypothetical protein Ta2D_04860 [Rickettsiales bacterium]